MKKLKSIIIKKNKKRPIELRLGLKKITNFTARSINKVYKNFKKKQKIEEKNELKFREEQVKKEQKKIELKIKEQSRRDNEIKIKEQDLKLREREFESKEKEHSTKNEKLKKKNKK